jgi:hypothetical protein
MAIVTQEDAEHFMIGTTGHPGVCLACDMVDEFAGCEPDAVNYRCPDCGEMKLCGFEHALTVGAVTIVD